MLNQEELKEVCKPYRGAPHILAIMQMLEQDLLIARDKLELAKTFDEFALAKGLVVGLRLAVTKIKAAMTDA